MSTVDLDAMRLERGPGRERRRPTYRSHSTVDQGIDYGDDLASKLSDELDAVLAEIPDRAVRMEFPDGEEECYKIVQIRIDWREVYP